MGTGPILKIQRNTSLVSFRTCNLLSQVDQLFRDVLEQSRVNMAAVEAGSMVTGIRDVSVSVCRYYLVGLPVPIYLSVSVLNSTNRIYMMDPYRKICGIPLGPLNPTSSLRALCTPSFSSVRMPWYSTFTVR